jgi:hypothetical protein
MGLSPVIGALKLEERHSAELSDLRRKYEDKDGKFDFEKVRSDREALDARFEEDRKEMRRKANWAGVSSLSKAQWFVFSKIFLDIAKLFGACLVVFAGLRIVADPEFSTSLKSYATVCAGITLLTVLLGGLVSLLG